MTSFDLADLHLHWTFIFKSFQTEDQVESLGEINAENNYNRQRTGLFFHPGSVLISLASKITYMLNISISSTGEYSPAQLIRQDLLWKHGGHPLLLRSPLLFNLEIQIYSLLAPFNFNTSLQKRDHSTSPPALRLAHWKEGIHPVYFYMDDEFKSIFAEAVATLHWLDTRDVDENSSMLESLEHTTQILTIRKAELEKQLERDMQREETIEASLLESERQLDPIQRKYDTLLFHSLSGILMLILSSLHRIWSQLWPLLDHFSSRQEIVLLAKLTVLLGTTTEESNLNKGVEELLPWVLSFVERGCMRTSRSPEDFVPYQRLLWKFGPRQSTRNVGPGSYLTREELIELVQEMKFRFHTRLWHNTYNDMSFLSPHSSTSDIVADLDFQVGRDSMGPPRLFQSVQSAFIFHLFADWRYAALTKQNTQHVFLHSFHVYRKSVSIEQHPERVKQLHSLSSLFRQSYVANFQKADWAILFSALIYVRLH